MRRLLDGFPLIFWIYFKNIELLNLQILLKRGTIDPNQKTSPSLELRQTVLKLTQNNEYCYLMNDAGLNSTMCKKNFLKSNFSISINQNFLYSRESIFIRIFGVPYHNRPSTKYLKTIEKRDLFNKTFEIFNANLNDSLKRTVMQNLIVSCIKSFFWPNFTIYRY
jgi:hypothetical protein